MTESCYLIDGPDTALEPFTAGASDVRGDWLVTLTGELDLATRDVVHALCLQGGPRRVVVDLAGVTFMDCSGYGALVRARRTVNELGATLVLRRASGEPARLLQLVGHDPT